MPELEKELTAYKGLQAELEARQKGKWVVIHEDKLIGVFDHFEPAAAEAVKLFGRGPYLIRQVGAGDLILPASVMYRLLPEHA